MVCYSPLQGWFSIERTKNGKRAIVFNSRDGLRDRPVSVPCGQCIGCRLERSRQWAVRCVHEAQCHTDNCFITLTYNDEHLPYDRSLNLRHFQLFMKRLRKRFGSGVRFFHCGEYGENFGRPHYHACLFNIFVPDRVLWSVRQNIPLYTSEILSSLWPFGFVTIGDVSFESAAYVARYCVKKVIGKDAPDHYIYVDEITGQIHDRQPEYVTMSRRPGIGRPWLDKFSSDVYPSDECVVNGVACRPPKFYDRVYEFSPSDFLQLKGSRVRRAKEHACDNTQDRLITRLIVQEERGKLLKRTLS